MGTLYKIIFMNQQNCYPITLNLIFQRIILIKKQFEKNNTFLTQVSNQIRRLNSNIFNLHWNDIKIFFCKNNSNKNTYNIVVKTHEKLFNTSIIIFEEKVDMENNTNHFIVRNPKTFYDLLCEN